MGRSNEITPPERLEKKLLASYPTLNADVENMLRLKDEVKWPDWCYLPGSASYAIVSGGADIRIAQRIVANNLDTYEAMCAILPWRLHKVIYRFDPDLVKELTEQDTLPQDIPAELLLHMPYPCVYIANPPGLDDCDGVFCYLEWDYRYPDAIELRMHYHFADDKIVFLFYQYTNNRAALVSQFAKNVQKTARELAGNIDLPDIDLYRWDQCIQQASKHMSMLVYLCSDEPDISRKSDVPRPRGRGAVKTPNWADKVDVGHYIGNTIRKGREEQQHAESAVGGNASSPRPHMRRAHWHLYWTGPGRTIPRVKWLAPIFVRGGRDAPPVVTHRVQ